MLEEMLRQQPADGRAVFVDMNSFFASCEQQAQPHLRGRPVGVCPFVSDATCVIAASIEAKRFGVKTAMRVPEAKRLCPDIVLVEANPRLYRDLHRRIMAELDNTHCRVVIKSIDEALLQVPSYLQNQGHQLAAEVKDRIRSVGDQLRCSVGIAPNMFLAKMGTSLRKPDGLLEVRTADLEAFYAPLVLIDLHGISWRMERRLKAIGIRSPLEFYRAPHSLLKKAFGVNGESWYLRLRGFEVDLKPTTRRMIGHQTTLVPNPAYDLSEVLSVASQLTYRAAIRLRASGLAARGITVYARYNDRTYWGRTYHGSQPFYDSATFFQQVHRLLSALPMRQPVRLVSVSAIDLIDARFVTRKLFDQRSREERLSAALDDINFRYGEATVVTARQLFSTRARDAIGFGNASQNAFELPH
jgi:DNA polymerase IV